MRTTVLLLLGAWFLLACVVGLVVGRWLRQIDQRMEAESIVRSLSDEELVARYHDEETSMVMKLAILDEQKRRNPLPPKPDDSGYVCEGCGS